MSRLEAAKLALYVICVTSLVTIVIGRFVLVELGTSADLFSHIWR